MLSFASSVRTNIFLDSKEVAAGEATADWGTVIDACFLGTQVSNTIINNGNSLLFSSSSSSASSSFLLLLLYLLCSSSLSSHLLPPFLISHYEGMYSKRTCQDMADHLFIPQTFIKHFEHGAGGIEIKKKSVLGDVQSPGEGDRCLTSIISNMFPELTTSPALC